MRIDNENGYVIYSINEDEITIDNIKVIKQRNGTGRELIEQVKNISISLRLPIGLYSYPQDNTIEKDDLNNFYYSCGFELDPNDCDNSLFIWRP